MRADDRDGGDFWVAVLGVLLVVGAASGTAGATSSPKHRAAIAVAAAARPAGAFGRFAASIVTQESNGNYRARSPAGALGRYQVMPGNIPAWSREILGREVTPAEFLDSPALQDRIALAKLRQAWSRYGPAGAAAWWYSGDPARRNDCSPVPGGPPVCVYVRQVLSRT